MEIGVFAPAGEGNASGEPIYLQKHRIRSTRQTIVVTVPRTPTGAGVVPSYLLIDLKMGDNIEEVKVTS